MKNPADQNTPCATGNDDAVSALSDAKTSSDLKGSTPWADNVSHALVKVHYPELGYMHDALASEKLSLELNKAIDANVTRQIAEMPIQTGPAREPVDLPRRTGLPRLTSWLQRNPPVGSSQNGHSKFKPPGP